MCIILIPDLRPQRTDSRQDQGVPEISDLGPQLTESYQDPGRREIPDPRPQITESYQDQGLPGISDLGPQLTESYQDPGRRGIPDLRPQRTDSRQDQGPPGMSETPDCRGAAPRTTLLAVGDLIEKEARHSELILDLRPQLTDGYQNQGLPENWFNAKLPPNTPKTINMKPVSRILYLLHKSDQLQRNWYRPQQLIPRLYMKLHQTSISPNHPEICFKNT